MLKKIIVGCLGLGISLFVMGSASANTIPVGGGCGLIDAINAANTDSVVGGCPAGSGADTITLGPAATYVLTNPYSGQDGLPAITSTIYMMGNGSTITRTPSAPLFRLMTIDPTGALYLSNITLSGGEVGGYPEVGGGIKNAGYLELINSNILFNKAWRGGGIALEIWEDMVTKPNIYVEKSLISNNSAEVGGGISIYTHMVVYMNWPDQISVISDSIISNNVALSYSGGGLDTRDSNVSLINSSFISNSAASYGGAIASESRLTITNGYIQNNSALNGGGLGVSYFGGQILKTVFDGNSANNGGAIYAANDINSGNSLHFWQSIVTGNSAKNAGAGIYVGRFSNYSVPLAKDILVEIEDSVFKKNYLTGYPSFGGAVYNDGRVEIENSTLFQNTSYMGGAIFNRSQFTGTHLTIADNTANIGQIFYNFTGILTIRNSLAWIATVTNDCIGTTGVTGSGNLSNSANCPIFTQSSSLNLGPAGNYGGNTETIPLLAGSSAIDSADQAYCLPTDQRGYPRPVDGDGNGVRACDIGAYEYYRQNFLPNAMRDFSSTW